MLHTVYTIDMFPVGVLIEGVIKEQSNRGLVKDHPNELTGVSNQSRHFVVVERREEKLVELKTRT